MKNLDFYFKTLYNDSAFGIDLKRGAGVSETELTILENLQECYTIRGEGGFAACIAVQEKLQDHGLCSYTRWDPEPPYWRFFFETSLEKETIDKVLGSLAQRYQIFYQ
ncbi:MAG: hypothetical protein B6I35_12735 [Anaerolineaceae bacterium 4572_32.2]|nr:MAG: hypothetical protein B6I35_12735 [Anaerolineaceae bacterium 4572_32.2]